MHPFILIAINRAEGRDWIAENFPGTSGWFHVLTPKSERPEQLLFLATYATPEALRRRNQLEMGRLFKLADRAVRAGTAASPQQVS